MASPHTAVAATDPPLREQVAPATSILLEAPALTDHGSEGCVDLLAVDELSATDLLCVTPTQSPDERLETWRRHAGDDDPARCWFVTTEDQARSAAAAGAEPAVATPDGTVRVDTVSNPGNLTQLGVAVTEQLRALAGEERRLVVCVHSLGTLLQFADTTTVFRFLHTLSGQIENAGALAHYHLDPAAHDDQTVRTIETLFDAVVTYDDGWTVRTRG